MKKYYVYFMSNRNNTVLYVGVTGNLERRVLDHRCLVKGFTARYRCTKLVYFEEYGLIEEAINRETQIKKWSRRAKDRLVDSMNPERVDLMPW